MSSAAKMEVGALSSLLVPGRGSGGYGRYLSCLWLLGALVTAQALFYTNTTNDMPKLGRRSSSPSVSWIDVLRRAGSRSSTSSLWDKRAPVADDRDAASRLSLLLDRAAQKIRRQQQRAGAAAEVDAARPDVEKWEPEEAMADPLEAWLSYHAADQFRRRLLSSSAGDDWLNSKIERLQRQRR